MKPVYLRFLLGSLGAVAFQAAQAQDTTAMQSDQAVRLDPFEVDAASNTGYGAQSSMSSSRLNVPYIEVPQHIDVETAEFMHDFAIADSRDFTRYIAGIDPATNAHQENYIYIHGFTTAQTYVDGFVTAITINRDAGLLDRVEYVEGPAAAALGRGEAGGLVNYVSKHALLDQNFGTIDLEIGTNAFYRAALDLNRKITKNLSVRIPVYTESENATYGGDNGKLLAKKDWGIGPALTWIISDNTTLEVVTSHQYYDGPANTGGEYWGNSYQPRAAILNSNKQDWVIGVNPYTLNTVGYPDGGRFDWTDELSLVLDHKFTDWLSYRQGVRTANTYEHWQRFTGAASAIFDPSSPGTNFPATSDFLVTTSYSDTQTSVQELKFQGDLLADKDLKVPVIGDTHQQLLFGYDTEQNRTANYSGSETVGTQDLYNPNYSLPATFFSNGHGYDLPFTTKSFSSTDNWGAYLQYSGWYVDHHLNLQYGVRMDDFFGTFHNLAAAGQPETTTRSRTSVPRYSATYEINKTVSVYFLHSLQENPPIVQFKYGQGFTGANGATLPPNSGATAFYYTQQIEAQLIAVDSEVGVKANLFDGKLTVSGSLYEEKQNGVILTSNLFVPGYNGIGTIQLNDYFVASGAETKGFSVTLFGQPTRHLTFTTSVAFINGTQPTAGLLIEPIPVLYDEVSFNGKYNFFNRYGDGLEFIAGGKLWLGGAVLTVQPTTGQLIINTGDQYELDVGANYFFGHGKYGVRVFCQNLDDKVIFLQANSQWGGRRTIFSVSAKF